MELNHTGRDESPQTCRLSGRIVKVWQGIMPNHHSNGERLARDNQGDGIEG